MDGEVAGFFVGTFFGFLIGIFVYNAVENINADSDRNKLKMAIEVCEQTLPRTQHCVITAVPEK